ncbi:phasin family protein [Pseudorhodoferax sp.]|uniref:phasin family protein n=1 Tax=Pseudorhodoferax sp. TaxID=1993553 RepID=UPI002DD6A334|nr:phasin family protein [Pseudorhodoferax sp.]
MVKKLKSLSEKKSSAAAGLLDGELAKSVKESAQQIWLAGMGAFSKAQEEGGKVFEALVKEGTHLQKKTQGIAEDKLSEVTGKMSAMADSVTARAGENWDKLESIFEQRTAKALSRLGVPTAKDVAALSARVEALAAAVARVGKAPAAKKARAATAPKAAPVKAAAKAPVKAAAKRTRKASV